MNKLRLRMILITVVATLATIVTAGAQEQRLYLPDSRMSVSNIFQEIRRQAYLGVAYRTDQIAPDRIVTLSATDISLGELLEIVTEGRDVEGVVDGDVIVFVKRTPRPRPIPLVKDDYVPTPLTEFRQSLGLRPKAVVLEGEQKMILQDALVEIDMPMESYVIPAEAYAVNQGMLPRFALKTNLLYGFVTLAGGNGSFTPNLSFEVGLGPKTSLELGFGINPWKYKGTLEDNRKLAHWLIKPEFRYWLCERFDGHFFGAHLLAGHYNIGTYEIPLLFRKSYRYYGNVFGAGVSYGYSLSVHKRWNVEFAVGAGVMFLKYDRYDCEKCSVDAEHLKKWYFGPTNASISLVFLIK